MTKNTLEKITRALVKPVIGLGIMGTILASGPNYAHAQTPPDNPNVQSTEKDTSTDAADAAISSFEAAEAKAREEAEAKAKASVEAGYAEAFTSVGKDLGPAYAERLKEKKF